MKQRRMKTLAIGIGVLMGASFITASLVANGNNQSTQTTGVTSYMEETDQSKCYNNTGESPANPLQNHLRWKYIHTR